MSGTRGKATSSGIPGPDWSPSSALLASKPPSPRLEKGGRESLYLPLAAERGHWDPGAKLQASSP